MTYWYIFCRLYVFNDWLNHKNAEGNMYPYSFILHHVHPGLERTRLTGTPDKGLLKEPRDGIFRMHRKNACLCCGGPLSKHSTGDHIIPTIKGGKDSIRNWLPFCRNCNSSKGKKDLIEWWIEHKGNNIV